MNIPAFISPLFIVAPSLSSYASACMHLELGNAHPLAPSSELCPLPSHEPISTHLHLQHEATAVGLDAVAGTHASEEQLHGGE